MINELPNRYQPDGNSASGGHGSVFFCDDTHLERKVAIKFVNSIGERRRLSDEIQALLQMRSKHVVQVFDVVVSKTGSLGIVQEYVDGDDLIESPIVISASEYLKILWQIASGIADIHEMGIIHRDIKPNNIKLTNEGIIKIFDFGLAREEGPAARTVGFVGTRGFAAPEQLRGGEFTKAVDVYAFGVTALFLGARELPASLLALPPLMPSSNPFLDFDFPISQVLADALASCLETDPERRPEISYLRDEIAKYLLFNRHQALAILQGKPSYICANDSFVSLEYPSVGLIDVRYNGLSFVVERVEGEVSINNSRLDVGDELPGSCVIALGNSTRRGNERVYMTFDVSYPEVVL